MQLECSNFSNRWYELVCNNYNGMHSILRWLLDTSAPERSNKGPKVKLKGGQKHKIVNIEDNNSVGVRNLPASLSTRFSFYRNIVYKNIRHQMLAKYNRPIV